jgi:predicted phosphodiesterase
MSKIIVLNDIHIPYQDSAAVKSALQIAKKYNPDKIIIGGDCIDFHAISRFLKNPRERNLKEEINQTREFLRTLRDIFPKADILFKEGNHEARLGVFLWSKAEEFSDLDELTLPSLLHFKEHQIQYYPKEKIIYLTKKLVVIHGHERGSICTTFPARSLFLTTNISAIAGHCHRQSSFVKRTITGELIRTYTTGCLCATSADYAVFTDWTQGIALVETNGKGEFDVTLKEI